MRDTKRRRAGHALPNVGQWAPGAELEPAPQPIDDIVEQEWRTTARIHEWSRGISARTRFGRPRGRRPRTRPTCRKTGAPERLAVGLAAKAVHQRFRVHPGSCAAGRGGHRSDSLDIEYLDP